MDVSAANWQHNQDYKVIDLPDGTVLLFITGNHRLFQISSQLGDRFRKGINALVPEEREEWNQLVETGIVSDVNRHRLVSSSFSDGADLAINVNLTAVCNLGCTYCFADGGDYGRITGKMESHTTDYIFDFLQDHLTASQAVRFEFFGGEPLLNFERIKEICDQSDKVHQETGINFIYRISTNLTVLPAGTLELFSDKKFIVSVSIDGDAETHNRNRPTKGGKESFDKIIKNCARVREASDDIILVARMTVIDDTTPLVENVRSLWNYNLFDYFQIYPGVVPAEKNSIFIPLDTIGNEVTDPTTTLNTMSPTYLQQLSKFAKVYHEFLNPTNRFRGVLEYERIVDLVTTGKMALSFCSGGRNYFTFSPDDSIMPCHRLVGDIPFKVGTGEEGITTDLTDWRLSVDEHPTCSKCWIRYICGGGCKQENYVATGNLNEPNPEMCNYQIQLVENIMQILAHQDESYRSQDRILLEDMFVSCGRPVIMNLRKQEERMPTNLTHFQAL